jgi:hypothetical protein
MDASLIQLEGLETNKKRCGNSVGVGVLGAR